MLLSIQNLITSKLKHIQLNGNSLLDNFATQNVHDKKFKSGPTRQENIFSDNLITKPT